VIEAKHVQHQIDLRALELSREALTRVEVYERHSEERMREMKEDIKANSEAVVNAITRVHDRVDSIFKSGIAIGGTIIMLLLGVIGYVLTSGLPWGVP
jgi:hypothetical protein